MTQTPPPLIRTAEIADLPAVVALLAQLSLDTPREQADDPLPPASYAEALAAIDADPRQQLYILEDSGRIAATMTVLIVPNLSHVGRPYALLESVVVDDSVRGRGYGSLMLRFAIERAREAGCYKVALTSNKARAGAHRFYVGLGFQATHEGFSLYL